MQGAKEGRPLLPPPHTQSRGSKDGLPGVRGPGCGAQESLRQKKVARVPRGTGAGGPEDGERAGAARPR